MNQCLKHGVERIRRTSGKVVCRLCDNEYQKAHYRSNPTKMRERKRNWMAKQRTTPEGKARQNEIQRLCWANGRGQRQKQYIKAFMVEHFFAWRARLFNSHFGTEHTARDFAKLWKDQRGKCALSGYFITSANAQIDHALPITRGGGHELANLQWVTNAVNRAKHNLTDREFLDLCNRVASWIGRRIVEAAEKENQ